MVAGSLDQRVRFERRGTVADADGNVVAGPWTEVFTVWGSIRVEAGRELVAQGRLASPTGAVVRIRRSSRSVQLTSDDRAVINGEIYAIHSIRDADARREMLDLVVESGVAS
jgi:SPP1 family predicted phage head-tail adaptor